MLKETIMNRIINGQDENAGPIDGLPPNFGAVSFRMGNEFGVAIPYDGKIIIDESFAGARLRSSYLTIGSEECKPYLIFSSILNDYEHNEIFAVICAHFVETDSLGEKRKRITSNPFLWWEDWKVVVGNSEKNRDTYPIIAEMISLDYMLLHGFDPCWEGPNNTTVDIRCPSFDCEVKSTCLGNRYNDEITISSQLQLLKTDRPLHLYYCNFQESEAGVSVSDMVERLKEHGASADHIEKCLSILKCPTGSASRMRKYQLLKIWDFFVDDSFPKITPDSFKDNKLPAGIKKISYTIDLSSLEYKPLEYM